MMRALVRAYAVALRAFPGDFRARFGPQMVEAFERHARPNLRDEDFTIHRFSVLYSPG